MSILKNLMVDVKEAWVEYPGFPGFELKLAMVSRPNLIALRKSCIETKFDRKTKAPIETLNEDKFVRKFTEASIKDWKGLKASYLESLLLVDLGDTDPDQDVPYNAEDAEMLVKHSGDFDQWLNDAVFDLENFRSRGERGAMGEA